MEQAIWRASMKVLLLKFSKSTQKAKYFHCAAHALNLKVCVLSASKVQAIRNMHGTIANFHCLKVLLSRVMRCHQEEKGDHVPGLGKWAVSTLLFPTTARFCDIKQRRNCLFLTSSLIATV